MSLRGKLFVAVCVTRISNIGAVVPQFELNLKYSNRQGSE